MELTYTILKFDTPDGVTHEIDFSDNKDKLLQLVKATSNNEVIKVQVKVQGKVYDVLSNQLYF